ncbi:WD40-repeat-containing domain protein [Mycotypha africana]|uniref:WD40-repeat-containing domain protein n=1 Tax=Mycotypha africana TaxID=64632 RepID=UPI0023019A90|nr:WD40-repeat-containing domain protein [Mycotypha africana]KAI8984124.1 WD40-repeat-containing domain protein [Mycotypha africana]
MSASTIDVQTCLDIIPPFNLLKGIDLDYNDDYIFEVTANSQYAITSASDRTVRLYNLNTLQLSHKFQAHEEKISQIKLKGDHHLFTASEDRTLKRWDLRLGGNAPVQTFNYKLPLTAFDINHNDTMAILGTEFSYDTQSADLAFFDTRNTLLLHTFTESHGDDITEIQCHPSLPNQFLSSSTDGLVNNYDVSEFDEEENMISVINPGSSVNKTGYFGPNAEYLYCLTHIETFSLHTTEGDVICDFGDIRNIPTTQVDYAIDCSYDPISHRFYLITGSNSGMVDFFHVNLGQLQHCQQLNMNGGHTDVVRSLFWYHPTQSLLTGGEDGRLCAWQGCAQ